MKAYYLMWFQIRELEALQAHSTSPIAAYLSALELREKPPPPYSPPSSESLSYSFRSFFINLDTDVLKNAVESFVFQVWDEWISSNRLPDVTVDNVLSTTASGSASGFDEKFRDESGNAAEWAYFSFNRLVSDVVKEVTRNILQVDAQSNYVDSVRRGPVALAAQNLRIPKTRDELSTAVFEVIMSVIPKLLIALESGGEARKKESSKWTCRPRDLVEEMLNEEMIEEEHLWSEIWPEEMLVKEDLCYKIMEDSVKSVINNLKIVFGG
jgi:hypothetical protein